MQTALQTTAQNLPATTFKILNDDEKYFLKVDQEYTIKQYESLNIQDDNAGYKGSQLARYHIGNALNQVFEMVGLKKECYPSMDLSKQMARFIQETFPYISPSELITAVVFGLQGKYNNLNSDGKSIFEHYGVMDIPYINTFMQLYVKYRYEKKVSIVQKVEKSSLPTKDVVMDRLQRDDAAVKELIIQAFHQYKTFRELYGEENDEERVTWLRDTWFYWLVDIGLIQYDRIKLNQLYNIVVAKRRRELNSSQCMHVVCVDQIYELFERLREQENPFEIFDHVTYLNADTYSQFGIAKA